MPDILTNIGGAINPLLGAGLGILTSGFNDQRQIEQQQKLMALQNQYDIAASQRNLENQLELWDKTNYPAQVQQMQKAGLSVGLMYKGGGQSGQIAADNVNRQAPTAANGGGMEIQQMMQMMLNNKMTEAQIENIKADTAGKEISNQNEGEGGINQQLKYTTIDNLIANTTNTEAKTSLTNAQKTAQDLANGITEGTMEATIGKAINEWKIGVNELYKSDKNTEWLKNNLPTAEQDFKNRLASSGIDNLLKSVQVGNTRQNTQESRQRVQNLKVAILDLYNQMKNRNTNTNINNENAQTNRLNYMNNVNKNETENKKINIMKQLQEQGLSIQETNTIINGISSLANAIDKLK